MRIIGLVIAEVIWQWIREFSMDFWEAIRKSVTFELGHFLCILWDALVVMRSEMWWDMRVSCVKPFTTQSGALGEIVSFSDVAWWSTTTTAFVFVHVLSCYTVTERIASPWTLLCYGGLFATCTCIALSSTGDCTFCAVRHFQVTLWDNEVSDTSV